MAKNKTGSEAIKTLLSSRVQILRYLKQAVGGVTVVGNGNVVRNEFVDVLRAMNQLEGVVKMSDGLTEDQKLDVQADIQTIKNQLSKSSPDKSILQKAMESISFVGSLPGVVEVFKVASQAVQKILGL